MDKIDFKKQLGQNFIFDTNLLKFIVKLFRAESIGGN